jgi:hypothetical protein
LVDSFLHLPPRLFALAAVHLRFRAACQMTIRSLG